MRIGKSSKAMLAAAAIAIGVLGFSTAGRSVAHRATQGSARLVKMEVLPDVVDSCTMPDANSNENLFAEFEPATVHASDTVDVTRPPVRTIKDSFPIYSSIAVDPVRDEIILQDTNLFGLKIFNRTDNTPLNSESTTPKRVIQGKDTHLEYNAGLTVDPRNGDIYSVALDTEDNVIVFPGGQSGDVTPRILKTPHRLFATGLDEQKNELYVTLQHPPKVYVFNKDATGQDKPLRSLEGPHTYLHDTHGIALDFKRKLMFVGSWGNWSDPNVAGSGKIFPPSINVYPLDADGDTAPIRIIQGPKTLLDWPGGIVLDPDTGNLWVANDVANNVLIFKGTDDGDVAPTQIIQGPKTGLSHPAGIAYDSKNKEIWVSNMGNSSATAFALTANGDAAPIRTIRSAPLGRKSVKFGKPQAVAFDSKRDLYLVPNCVNTPQIAAFPRLATENTAPVSALEGQKTMISRTMHALEYDRFHDELVVNTPLNGGIITFRGGASGEEPPVRMIMGPHTQIMGTAYDGNDKMAMDTVNGEIYIGVATVGGAAGAGKGVILVFDRLANGDAAPKRVLGGPDTGFTFPTAKGQGFPHMVVDPVRNLLLVSTGGTIMAFDRTASGNAKPKWVIGGSETLLGGGANGGPVRVTEKGWIVVGCDRGSVCAFSINDRGNVAPHWKVPVTKIAGVGLAGQLTLDPIHKELIVPNGARNVVMTFAWPEVFDETATPALDR
jgi:DNA-binding beta-propeller fold protein YncE